ncbi:hypothetical protein OY671_012162, partial [Metschnikowia pulcherrima]
MITKNSQSPDSSRRATLGLLSGGAAAVAIMPRAVRASGGTIVVSNWGGDWNDRTVRYVEKPLLEDRGFNIVRDSGTESERKAKLISERRIRRASADIIHVNSADAFELHQQGVVAELDAARIP